MRVNPVPRCWLLTWQLPVLPMLMLYGCASEPQVVFRDRPVEVPVAVVKPLPERLTRDCAPKTQVPYNGALTVADLLERLAAVEDSNALCWGQITEIRAMQP